MVIAGAGGHALEILDILVEQINEDEIYFFDNLSKDAPDLIFNRFPIIKSEQEVQNLFRKDKSFCLGVGSPTIRHKLAELFIKLGGELTSVKSNTAHIAKYKVDLAEGLNIMHHVVINNATKIGNGTLINSKAEIHHEVEVGQYCEISPSVQLLGKVKIGSFCSIGTGAIILPGLEVGDHVVVGAGAVVTKNVKNNQKVVGVPAKTV